MQRYFTLIVLLLFSFPVGLSITGCTTKVDNYCNNAGFGPKLTAINSVSLSGGTVGVSLAYGQISTAGTALATNCRGTTLSVGAPTYGSSNINLADINPGTGALCGRHLEPYQRRRHPGLHHLHPALRPRYRRTHRLDRRRLEQSRRRLRAPGYLLDHHSRAHRLRLSKCRRGRAAYHRHPGL